ncbi:MAG TPA: DotU family type IV/VI secretion system protein [Kofleriaceae bacterium]|nr:DotU family type IV/VI secretion system protein [Kofleriaceae bacterium]
MTPQRWREILAACGDVDRLVNAAVAAYPGHAPPSTERPRPRAGAGPQLVHAPPQLGVEPDPLQRLHREVDRRIELLRAAFAAEPGSEPAMLALVQHFDERIMQRLPDHIVARWPLLQTRLSHSRSGGTDFFRLIDHLLGIESTPRFVLEIYLFCLRRGFEGEHAGDPAKLKGFRERLRARIETAKPAQRSEAAAAPSALPLRSPALHYAVAVVVVVVAAVLLTVWSNQ